MADLARVLRTEIVVDISKKIESGWDLGSRGYNGNLYAYDKTTWTYNSSRFASLMAFPLSDIIFGQWLGRKLYIGYTSSMVCRLYLS